MIIQPLDLSDACSKGSATVYVVENKPHLIKLNQKIVSEELNTIYLELDDLQKLCDWARENKLIK